MRRLIPWIALTALALVLTAGPVGSAAGLPALMRGMALPFAAQGDSATPSASLGATPGASPAATPAASPAATPACPAAASSGRVVAVANDVTIRLTDEGFDPATIQATSGHDLTISLVNAGSRPHAFVLEFFAIDVELAPGASETVTVTPGDRGDAVSYTFVSDVPGDECMQGLLVFYV